ncbi:MAG: peptidoglycan endopeptidase [Thermodesulfovibrionales bacterium]|nr:peptidoglycan endopeptidase [Thermodesulfovibrionales bacterium]
MENGIGFKEGSRGFGVRAASVAFALAFFLAAGVCDSFADLTYTVKKGDTLFKIARNFKLTVGELKAMNGLGSSRIKKGQRLYLKRAEETQKAGQEAVLPAEEKLAEDLKSLSEQPASSPSVRLALIAGMMLDMPYKFGGSTLKGLDCSAFVQKVFGFEDVILPRVAREQFKLGIHVERGELNIGDLVFFRTYARFPSHVGIYLGNNLFIHASSKVRKVTIDSLDAPYYFRRFIGAKRILDDRPDLPGGLPFLK